MEAVEACNYLTWQYSLYLRDYIQTKPYFYVPYLISKRTNQFIINYRGKFVHPLKKVHLKYDILCNIGLCFIWRSTTSKNSSVILFNVNSSRKHLNRKLFLKIKFKTTEFAKYDSQVPCMCLTIYFTQY